MMDAPDPGVFSVFCLIREHGQVIKSQSCYEIKRAAVRMAV